MGHRYCAEKQTVITTGSLGCSGTQPELPPGSRSRALPVCSLPCLAYKDQDLVFINMDNKTLFSLLSPLSAVGLPSAQAPAGAADVMPP